MPIESDDHLLMITNRGTVIRCPVKDVRISGRATQGVVVFKTAAKEIVVSAEKIPGEDENDDDVNLIDIVNIEGIDNQEA